MTAPNNSAMDEELDLDDKLTYDIFHIVGAVANEQFSAGLLTDEEEPYPERPDFDYAVREILAKVAQPAEEGDRDD